MSERYWRLFAQDMLDSIGRIRQYTQGLSYEEFARDSKTLDAYIATLIVSVRRRGAFQSQIKSTTLMRLGRRAARFLAPLGMTKAFLREPIVIPSRRRGISIKRRAATSLAFGK